MGASRHAADIRADKPSKESQTILHLQSGELPIFTVAVYLYDMEAEDVISRNGCCTEDFTLYVYKM